ncbi:hypothetical protein J2Y40_002207 [Chryseobacterium sp. 2987]|nr:hypothetical protein [Chryseobacterium sp. 2987]
MKRLLMANFILKIKNREKLKNTYFLFLFNFNKIGLVKNDQASPYSIHNHTSENTIQKLMQFLNHRNL